MIAESPELIKRAIDILIPEVGDQAVTENYRIYVSEIHRGVFPSFLQSDLLTY
jgi:hypothetical protein